MIHLLGPLSVIFAAVLGWWAGRIIGCHLANRRDRGREMTARRRPSATAIQHLQDDVDVPLDEYVRRHIDRELGLTSAQPIRRTTAVCLTKNCQGDTDEIRTWSGQLIRAIHTCE